MQKTKSGSSRTSSREGPQSNLIDTVRKIHELQREWVGEFQRTGSFNLAAIHEMAMLRFSLYSEAPATPLDALLLLGAIRSVASFHHAAEMLPEHDRRDLLDDEIRASPGDGLQEILVGMDALRRWLEQQAGQSLQSLAFFQDPATTH